MCKENPSFTFDFDTAAFPKSKTSIKGYIKAIDRCEFLADEMRKSLTNRDLDPIQCVLDLVRGNGFNIGQLILEQDEESETWRQVYELTPTVCDGTEPFFLIIDEVH